MNSILEAIVGKLTALVTLVVALFGLSHPLPQDILNNNATSTVATTSTAVTATSSLGVMGGETVWGSLTPAGWDLSFSVEVPWMVKTTKDASGNATYITASGNTSAVVISKDLHIAAPGTGTPSITTQVIAGQSVQVSKYDNPQKGYAYALSFVLPVKGSSSYYFLFQSTATSTKVADDFISLIK